MKHNFPHLRIEFAIMLVLLTSEHLFSQSQLLFSEYKPAYLVFNDGDTVYGSGGISQFYDYCMLKRAEDEHYRMYYPNEVKSFRIIDGKYYVSKVVSNSDKKPKWYFLEYLVDGAIDLYAIPSQGRYFIHKENGEFLELNDKIRTIKEVDGKDYMVQDKRYIGYLRVYMAEAPELFPKIDKLRNLNQRDLVKLSVEYHNLTCDDYGCINYAKNIPKVTYKLEVLSGATYHNNYYSPQAGVLVHIWRPLKNERLYWKTGILYSDKPSWKKSDEDEFEYNIKVPMSFQYVFGKNKFKPTVAVGCPTGIMLVASIQGGFIYSLSEKVELSVNSSIDGLFLTTGGLQRLYFKNDLAHSLNFGVIYRIE